MLRVVRWLLSQPLSSSVRCAWVCSLALSRNGLPATWAWMRLVAIPLVVHSARGQREAAIVQCGPCNFREPGWSSRSFSAWLRQLIDKSTYLVVPCLLSFRTCAILHQARLAPCPRPPLTTSRREAVVVRLASELFASELLSLFSLRMPPLDPWVHAAQV